MTGTVGILNVGAGDTKIIFDPNNPQDCVRAARIVKDMLRRGYALLVEITQTDGSKIFQRAYDFIEGTYEYVIADLDPYLAAQADAQAEPEARETYLTGMAEGDSQASDEAIGASSPRPATRKVRKKRVSATRTRAVAVARSAGG